MHSLDNKIALVTGGTRGIGREVAENFVHCGATVVITGRSGRGEQAAGDIGARFERCDASDESQVEACFDAVRGSLGKIDVLVINAGAAADEGSIEDFDSALMERLVDVNFKGVFYALKHGARNMAQGGSIITTGSVAGAGTTNAGSAVYSATKAGVAYLTRTAAIELAPRGIRANTVCPAVIAGTGMMIDDDGSAEAQFFASLTALGRMGRLEEVAGAYNFLASDAASFITGQELRIDGGMTAGVGQPAIERLTGN